MDAQPRHRSARSTKGYAGRAAIGTGTPLSELGGLPFTAEGRVGELFLRRGWVGGKSTWALRGSDEPSYGKLSATLSRMRSGAWMLKSPGSRKVSRSSRLVDCGPSRIRRRRCNRSRPRPASAVSAMAGVTCAAMAAGSVSCSSGESGANRNWPAGTSRSSAEAGPGPILHRGTEGSKPPPSMRAASPICFPTSCGPASSPSPAAVKRPMTSTGCVPIQRSSWPAGGYLTPAGTCARSRQSPAGRMRRPCVI